MHTLCCTVVRPFQKDRQVQNGQIVNTPLREVKQIDPDWIIPYQVRPPAAMLGFTAPEDESSGTRKDFVLPSSSQINRIEDTYRVRTVGPVLTLSDP